MNENQPVATFIYRNQQFRIPLRYLYINNNLTDFGEGLEAGIVIVPSVVSGNGNTQINRIGSLIYLSPKTFKSLFAQLYLMDDPLKKYKTIKLAHAEDEQIIKSINFQGTELEFLFLNGLRGPIKIWKVDYPDNIKTIEKFQGKEGEYAEFDNTNFTK